MRRMVTGLAVLLLTAAAVPLAEAPAGADTAPSACSIAPLPASPAVRAIHRRIASAGTERVRLLALGSSTTYGADLADRSQRWPDRLMHGLKARGYDADPASVEPLSPRALSQAPGALMVDGAVPGATAETYLAEDLPGWLLSRVTGNTATIVLHMVGANDYYDQNPPAVYGAALGATSTLLDTQLRRPIQVYVNTFADPATTNPHYRWSAYRAQMRRVAAADPAHRAFVDLAPWFRRAGVPGADPHGYIDAGGVHPTPVGQAMIARLVLRALRYGC